MSYMVSLSLYGLSLPIHVLYGLSPYTCPKWSLSLYTCPIWSLSLSTWLLPPSSSLYKLFSLSLSLSLSLRSHSLSHMHFLNLVQASARAIARASTRHSMKLAQAPGRFRVRGSECLMTPSNTRTRDENMSGGCVPVRYCAYIQRQPAPWTISRISSATFPTCSCFLVREHAEKWVVVKVVWAATVVVGSSVE